MAKTKAAIERSIRWSSLRGQLRGSKRRVKGTRQSREAELLDARGVCTAERLEVNTQCKKRRKKVRSKAHQALDKEKAFRDDAWATYRFMTGKGAPVKTKMTRAESDSLAEHSVPPHLLEVWRKHRRKFSYKLAPDARVEKFVEWIEEHPREVMAEQAAKYEHIDWGKLEQKQHELEQYEEAIPF